MGRAGFTGKDHFKAHKSGWMFAIGHGGGVMKQITMRSNYS